MKCSVYILKNQKGRHYTGITELSPQDRLDRHNNGDVYSTKFHRPWTLVYIEEYGNMLLARKREKQIKSWHGGGTLKRFLCKAAGSSNGRTPPFEGDYLGSNPGPAALHENNEFGLFGGLGREVYPEHFSKFNASISASLIHLELRNARKS